MSFKNAQLQLQLKKFTNDLTKIVTPKKTSATSVTAAFNDYFAYLFDVAKILNPFFKDPTFAELLQESGVEKEKVENLKLWSTMVNTTQKEAGDKLYYGGQRVSYLKKLASVQNPESAIQYIESVFGIRSKTNNPAELVAAMCDSMAHYLYNTCEQTKSILAQIKEPTQNKEKKSVFGVFKGRSI